MLDITFLLIGALPSLAFMIICLYAVIDAEHVDAATDMLLKRWDKNARETQ